MDGRLQITCYAPRVATLQLISDVRQPASAPFRILSCQRHSLSLSFCLPLSLSFISDAHLSAFQVFTDTEATTDRDAEEATHTQTHWQHRHRHRQQGQQQNTEATTANDGNTRQDCEGCNDQV